MSTTLGSSEKDSLSLRTNYESSSNTTMKLDIWFQVAKRIVRFFRLMKISTFRARFIHVINHCTFTELNDYQTNRVREDILFLDDVDRYHEVFNTFISFGFTWQNKEFRLAKLKAIYIYDRYMSTPETLIKTNIPADAVPIISNRINSSKTHSSSIYLNLFNNAEKFIREKLLFIYLRQGLNCPISKVQQQTSTPITNQLKPNSMINGSNSSFEHSRAIKTKERPKEILSIQSQHDEILIPNWTYSIATGVIYNPIREKIVRKNVQKKTTNLDVNMNTTVETAMSTTLLNPQIYTIPVRHSRQHVANQSLLIHQHNTRPTKTILDKRQVFICRAHSSSWTDHTQHVLIDYEPYRMSSFRSEQNVHVYSNTYWNYLMRKKTLMSPRVHRRLEL
ncbi:unnamed protein product [Adineta ricciae]|uniref:RGS domain-containing protein n=1 Tax=Adineta ricciae TaxID=249248 RepID=A0A814KXH9_ADIRI|nr:unnamed protein product [Adineta ricciae]CAF1569675.1 unnamed protein product [Adineta ricciae]